MATFNGTNNVFTSQTATAEPISGSFFAANASIAATGLSIYSLSGDNVGLAVTFNVISGSNAFVRYYKRGFYTVTNQFEYWYTTNRDGAPPSGNPLIDITVLSEIKDF